MSGYSCVLYRYINCSITTAASMEESAQVDAPDADGMEVGGGSGVVIAEDAFYSSIADDVYYLLQKTVDRAVGTGYADAVCAIVNNSVSVLKRWLLALLADRVNRNQGWPALVPDHRGRALLPNNTPSPSSSLCALNSLDVCGQNLRTFERALTTASKLAFETGSSGHRKVVNLMLFSCLPKQPEFVCLVDITGECRFPYCRFCLALKTSGTQPRRSQKPIVRACLFCWIPDFHEQARPCIAPHCSNPQQCHCCLRQVLPPS